MWISKLPAFCRAPSGQVWRWPGNRGLPANAPRLLREHSSSLSGISCCPGKIFFFLCDFLIPFILQLCCRLNSFLWINPRSLNSSSASFLLHIPTLSLPAPSSSYSPSLSFPFPWFSTENHYSQTRVDSQGRKQGCLPTSGYCSVLLHVYLHKSQQSLQWEHLC